MTNIVPMQPDKVKVPLQFHVGQEDGFKGFADPEVGMQKIIRQLPSKFGRQLLNLHTWFLAMILTVRLLNNADGQF